MRTKGSVLPGELGTGSDSDIAARDSRLVKGGFLFADISYKNNCAAFNITRGWKNDNTEPYNGRPSKCTKPVLGVGG